MRPDAISSAMSPPRLFVDADLAEDLVFDLADGQAHYLGTVLRRAAGDAVALFNGRHGEWEGQIAAIGKGRCRVRLRRRLRAQEAESPLHLVFAPVKRARIDYLVEKATELGVARFLPLTTARTRVTLKESALDKIRRRTIEAAKQCGRNRLPVVSPTATIETLAREERGKHDLALLPDTQNARPLKDVLRAVPTARSAIFVVGPEGGFEDRERKSLGDAGFVPVVFGGATLRVETAAIAVLTCLRYDLG